MPQSPFATTNLHTGDARVRQVYEMIDIMSPEAVPFLKLVGIDGEAGENPKIEWLEDTLLAESSLVVAGGVVSSSSATILNVTTGDGVNFQPYEVIKINPAGVAASAEYLYITAVNADALTVVRGVAGSSAASTITAGDTVEIVGLANRENVDAPTKGTTDLTIPYNYFQAFDTGYQISEIARNTKAYGVPQGEDARELAKAFKEVMVKLENTAFKGVRRVAETVGGVSIPPLMGGLNFFFSSAYNSLYYSADLSSAPLQEKDLNDMLQNRFYAVGQENMGKTLLVGAWNKRRVNDIYATTARSDRSERRGGVIVDTIDTDFGPIDVVLSLRAPKEKVFLLNLDWITIHPYKGLAFYDAELAKNGAYVKRQIYGVYTMRLRNNKAMGLINNTSIS
jgi:hypothetical protein